MTQSRSWDWNLFFSCVFSTRIDWVLNLEGKKRLFLQKKKKVFFFPLRRVKKLFPPVRILMLSPHLVHAGPPLSANPVRGNKKKKARSGGVTPCWNAQQQVFIFFCCVWFACVFDRFPHSFSLRALTKAHLFDAVQNMHEKLLCEITDISRQEKCQLVFWLCFSFFSRKCGCVERKQVPSFPYSASRIQISVYFPLCRL